MFVPGAVLAAALAKYGGRSDVAMRRSDREPAPISEHTVILVDDGLATGATCC